MQDDYSADSPMGRVVAELSKNGKHKRSPSGWHMFRCPCHNDSTASLAVYMGDRGVVLKCHAGCAVEAIVATIGLQMKDLFLPDNNNGPVDINSKRPAKCTLEELAANRKLSVEYLRDLGWKDGPNGIEQPYVTRDGEVHVTKIRKGLNIKDGTFTIPSGKQPMAYEPDHGALSRAEGFLVLVEGETDTVTLLHAGFPALGIPGADTVTKTLEAHHLEGVRKVFYIREPDAGGEKFSKLVPERLEQLGFTGESFAIKLPGIVKDPSVLWQRDTKGFRDTFSKLIADVQAGPFKWLGVSDIFVELPPVPWAIKGLQICPGRPAMLVGYGASAKTISAQALATAVASGVQAWGNFETKRGKVRHMDYEQGFRATARRYQRLAVGLGIDAEDLRGRLELAVFPGVYLDSENAYDAYAKACEGTDLVILDALRGATPTMEENDSSIRKCIDNLTRVSERVGSCFVVIHHAGKPRVGAADGGDSRMNLRGSSAIFDGAGCVIELKAGASNADPKSVHQAKMPAESEGLGFEDFLLEVTDITQGQDPFAGLRVLYRSPESPDDAAQRQVENRLGRQHTALMAVIKTMRGKPFTKSFVCSGAGGRKSDMLELFSELERAGAVVPAGADERGTTLYRHAQGVPL